MSNSLKQLTLFCQVYVHNLTIKESLNMESDIFWKNYTIKLIDNIMKNDFERDDVITTHKDMK